MKADDGNADLVYIWKFAPEYHIREVTINVNGEAYGTSYLPCWMWWSGVRVGSALSDFEQAMMDAGFNPAKNQYTYTIAGYEDKPQYKGDINSMDPDFAPIAVPYGHDDLVINITATNEDIKVSGNLILNVTPDDAGDDVATPAWSIDMTGGNVRYGFVVDDVNQANIDNVVSVAWRESITSNGQPYTNAEWRTADKSDLFWTKIGVDAAGNDIYGYVVYYSLPGSWSASNEIIVHISEAVINLVEQDDPQQIVKDNVTLNVAQPGKPDSLSNSGKNYTFEVPANESPAARIMTMAETKEPEMKWVVTYTESVTVNGGSPVETDKTYEVLASEVVGDTIVVRDTVDERATFDDKDTVVITITINSITKEPVNPPKTTNTLTLQGAGWRRLLVRT